jgi:hypothetical protein
MKNFLSFRPIYSRALPWLVSLIALFSNVARAQWTVVDAGSTPGFFATTGAMTYAWTLDGATVGTNSATFSYTPDASAVGTHWLQVKRTLPDGSTATQQWGVRVRIGLPTSPQVYYVSPSGSDNNGGTIGAPFLTLEKARDTIRLLPRPLAAGGVTVYLRGGIYNRTATFALTSSDSGTSSAPIIYSAYAGENVVLTTGKSLASASFSPLAASEQSRVVPGVDATRIWETDASAFTNRGPYPPKYETWPVRNARATTTSLPDVFYNGSRSWLSRYPNHNLTDDYLTPNLRMNGIATDVTGTAYLNGNGTRLDGSNTPVSVGGAFGYNPADADRVARWRTALSRGGVWLQGYWRVTWQSSIAQVLDIDTTAQVITFRPNTSPNGGFGNKYAAAPAGYTGRPGNRVEPYWVMNLLEEMDQPGEWCIDFNRNKLYFLMDQAGAPPDNSVVIADNISTLIQMTGTSNVILQSLKFQRSLGTGVDISSGTNNLILGCSFQNLTGMAVYLGNNANNNGIVSCNLNEMGSMGIQIGAGTNGDFNTGNFVVNTRMTGISRYAQVYQPGINITENASTTQPSIKLATNFQNRIAHNDICDTPQMGVQFDGAQGIYEYNHISKYGTLVDDTGSFYSYEDDSGNDTFRYNFSHDTVLGNAITYDGTIRVVSGRFYGNLSQQDAACEGQSIGIGTFSQIDCTNNMSVGGGRYGSFLFKSIAQSNINNNVAVAGFYPPDFRWDPNSDLLSNGPNLSYVTDPGFTNLTGRDLRLRPDSKVLTDLPDFKSIPFEMIGLYNDEYRTDGVVLPPYATTSGGTFTNGGADALLHGTLVYPLFDLNTSVSVYYGNADGGTDPAAWSGVVNLGTLAAGSFSATVTGVSANQPLYYRILTTNPAGQTWSEPVSAAYPSVPAAPTGMTVIPGYAQNLLTWNPATYAAGYVIQRATALGGPYTTLATGVATTSYTDAGLITGTTYYYTVTASNGTGSSSATSPVTGVPVPGTALKADNSTSLDQGSSWSLGVIPAPADNALWAGIYSNATAEIGGGLAVNQLQLTNPSRAISISAGNGNLAIGSGGIDLSAATQNLTINCPVALAGSQTWSVATGRTLTISGAISDAGQGFSLSTGGYGPVVLSGNSTISGSLNIAAPAGGLPTYKYGGNNPSGYIKLGGTVGPVVANGRLDILAGVTPVTISGSGGTGLIYNSGTSPSVLTFQSGSSFSMFQIGSDNAQATLRQTGSGPVSFSYFGYNVTAPNSQTTFDGGTWTLGQIGQNNSSAQTSGTVNILGGAGVTITNPRYSHGTWNVSNGTLQFSGNVSEENGSNVPLNTSLNLNVSGPASSLLIIGSLTLGDGGSGTNANGLSIAGGTARMTNLTFGTATAGHADTNTVALSGGKLAITGTLASVVSGTVGTLNLTTTAASPFATIPSGSGQRSDLAPGLVLSGNPNIPGGTTIASITGSTITLSTPAIGDGLAVPTTVTGGSQNNAFVWTGGQLTAASITAGAGFNAAGSNLAGGTFNQTAGTLAPGEIGTAGKTVITGNYQLGTVGLLAVDLGGTTQATAYQTGQYDYLTVSGTTTVAGNLALALVNGFTPSNGTTFTVLNSTGMLSGAFANVAFGQRLTTTGGEGSFLVSKTTATVTASQYLKALDTWRLVNFGTSANTGTAADTADPDGDGGTNLMEYALGTLPTSSAPVANTQTQVVSNRLTLTFSRVRSDVTYFVEGSSDFTTWAIIATNPGTVGQSVTVTDTVDIPTANPPRRFLRLRVSVP